MHLFELTRKLIEIESITGNEKQIAFFLRDYLAGLGYRVTLQEAASERFNVQAFLDEVRLWFSRPTWTPSRRTSRSAMTTNSSTEEAPAMPKGIIAAQIEAAERLRADGENRFGLLFVVGEERNSAGALLANGNPPGSRYFIDGEPTENRLALASKGSLRVEMVARGRSAHSAYPEQGESAILKLLDVLQDLRSLDLPSRSRAREIHLQHRRAGRRHKTERHSRLRPSRGHVPFGRTARETEGTPGSSCPRPLRDPLQVRSSDRAHGGDGGLRDDRGLLRERCRLSSTAGANRSWSARGRSSMPTPTTSVLSKRELLAGADLYVRLARRLLAGEAPS